jgi:ubiquitin-conjugating enzyme E2 O
MARLEELFIINPQLQSQEIMKKLLMVYKKCRYLDRLMNTSFFHEEHFMGLVERVRKVGNQTTAERVQDQKNRLFNQTPSKASIGENGKNIMKKSKLNDSQKSESISTDDQTSLPSPRKSSLQVQHYNLSTSSDISSLDEIKIDNDSGHYSNRTDPTSYSNNDLYNSLMSQNFVNRNESSVFSISSDIETDHSSSECVSARLCRLIKAQLIKALQAVSTESLLKILNRLVLKVFDLFLLFFASLFQNF